MEAADAAIVEVNVNLGHLQFRQHAVTPVPKDVQAMPEFQEIRSTHRTLQTKKTTELEDLVLQCRCSLIRISVAVCSHFS